MQRRRTPLRRAHSPNTTVLGLTPAAMAQHIQEQEELRLLKSKNSAMRRRLEENGRYPWSPGGRPSSALKKTSALSQWASTSGVALAAATAGGRDARAPPRATPVAPASAASATSALSAVSAASRASSSSAASPSADALRAEKVAATVALWSRSATTTSPPAPAPSPPQQAAPPRSLVRRELTYDGAEEVAATARLADERRRAAERDRDALQIKYDALARENAAIRRQALAEIAKYRPTPLSRLLASLACWAGLLLAALALARELPRDVVRDRAH